MTDKASLFLDAWTLAALAAGCVVLDEASAVSWPRPEPEHRFHPIRRWRFDFAFPAAKVAVEVDGGQWTARGGRHATDSDREKLNQAAAMGWRVLRFSPDMLRKDPLGCAAVVRQALASSAPDGYDIGQMLA